MNIPMNENPIFEGNPMNIPMNENQMYAGNPMNIPMNENQMGGETPPERPALMESLIQPLKLIVRSSPLSGYGVFATKNIKEGEIIEEACFAKTQYRSRHLVADEIRQICYTLPCSCEMCKHAGRNFVLSSGYISVYNHGEKEHQNVKFEWNSGTRVIRVIAMKDISKDNEVLHSYGDNYNKLNQEVR